MFRLRRFLKDYKLYFFGGPLLKLIEAIFELIVPLVTAKIIDTGIKNADHGYILKMSAVIAVLGILGLTLALIGQYFAAKCGCGYGTDLRRELFAHISSFSEAEYDKINASSLITRITNDTYKAQSGINMLIRIAVRSPFLIIGATALSMIIDLKLSLIFWLAGIIIAIIIYFVVSRSVPLFKLIQKKLDWLSVLSQENLEGARNIRAFSKQ
jgi:ATP-binding cassette subfamily B protein